MKIAVTGSSGFIGSKLVERLKELDHDVIEIDIKNGIDITIWEQARQLDEFDILIHLAAKLYIPDSFKHPREFYETNVASTLNALELCKIHQSKMIFASSYLYGNPQYLPVDEVHPISALNPYSRSKVICEQLCEGYHFDFGVPVIILRPFNVYGKGQDENFLIPSIIRQAKAGEIVLNDPAPKRDMLHVQDMVEAYVKCLELKNYDFEVFNIGSGTSHSVEEITDTIVKQYTKRITVTFTNKKRKNEVAETLADIRKAKEILKWEPKISLPDGLKLSL